MKIYLFIFLVAACGIYFSGQIKLGLAVLGVRILNCWATREVPIIVFFFFKSQIMHLIVKLLAVLLGQQDPLEKG